MLNEYNLPMLAIDTEYGRGNVPFIGTVANTNLEASLYDLRVPKDVAAFKKLCESPKIDKVFHAITNDIYALSKIGITVKPPYECTMIAASLVNENFASRKLKVMARQYLDEPCEEEKLLSKVKAKLKREAKKRGEEFYFDQIPREIVEPYATKDPIYTIKLWFLFYKRLQPYRLLYNFEKKLVPINVEMQEVGLCVDRRFVRDELKKIDPIMEARLASMVKLAKDPAFNPNSPKQVGAVLAKLKILDIDSAALDELTEKGDVSTAAPVLKKYMDKHAFVRDYIEYKFYAKQKSTYYGPLYNRYTSDEDPNAHFSFYQSGAKTGRYSAELIQTIPKRDEDKLVKKSRFVRKAFIPSKGFWFLSLDFAQIEMRVFVHYSKCRSMAKHIINGYDPHLGTAWDIFGKEFIEKLDKDTKKFYRKIMKDINFGIIYGMGKRKMIRQMLGYGFGLTSVECDDIFRRYYAKYPVKQFMAQVTRELFYSGVIKLEINSPLMKFKREYNVPQNLAYKGVNVIVQGMSAYILKHSMIRTTNLIEKRKWNAKLAACIHDENLFKISNEHPREEVIPQLVNAMEDKVSFDVPILVDAKWSEKSWGELEDVEPKLMGR